MAFEMYYRALARRGRRGLPSADEARRDYQDSLRNQLHGMLFTR